MYLPELLDDIVGEGTQRANIGNVFIDAVDFGSKDAAKLKFSPGGSFYIIIE